MAAATISPPNDLRSPKTDGDTRFLDPKVIARISNIELVARLIVQGFLIGLHKSPYHGFSSEFSAYRKYAKGDSFKFIDWKVVARTDRIYIKQFEENTNTRCYILLDASGSMRFGGEGALTEGTSPGIQKWIYGRNLAAALAYLMINQGDAAGLAVFRDSMADVISARSSTVHLHQLYTLLSKLQPEKTTDTEKGLARLPERFPKRGLIVMISDLLDDADKIISALKGFSYRRHEILLFHLLAPEEREFPYRDNTEFVDAETNEIITAQGSYIAKAYKEAMTAHTEKIKRFCRQSDIDFVPLSTSEMLSTALLAYLNKRQKAF
ncbi:MAG TPA: DUF58 domain-containing protein [Planctomycetota bacterium]|nr:DUF58 domain-containing protein [Planctomycetota bacterium]